jgi:hypothetical protein
MLKVVYRAPNLSTTPITQLQPITEKLYQFIVSTWGDENLQLPNRSKRKGVHDKRPPYCEICGEDPINLPS